MPNNMLQVNLQNIINISTMHNLLRTGIVESYDLYILIIVCTKESNKDKTIIKIDDSYFSSH